MPKLNTLATGVACATLLTAATAFAQNDMSADNAADEAAQNQAQDQARGDVQTQPRDGAGPEAIQDAAAADDAPFDNDVQRLSYALGYMIGSEYGRNDVELDPNIFARGLATGLQGGDGAMDQQQIQMTLMNFQRQMQARQMQRFQEQAKQGEDFLTENKAKEGVEETTSGLQYQVLQQGDGQSPAATDTVRVHYRGTLVDGTEFDSSYERGQPAEFKVNQVIPGWTEALQMMKPGAKYKLFIPSALAYGESGRPPVIPPNAVLIFDVELLDIVE